MTQEIDSDTGFTLAEKSCHDSLIAFWNRFVELPRQHPDEAAEVSKAVHTIQGIMTTRIARRCYPEGWPVVDADGRRVKTIPID